MCACGKVLYVKFMCVKLLYVKFVCVKLLYVKDKVVCVCGKVLYVKFVCVKLLYVKCACVREAAGGGGGTRDTESKTRTPHKVVGKKSMDNPCFPICDLTYIF